MITKDTTLEEILKYYEAHTVLAEFSVPCLTCPMAAMEMNKLKIGEICETYGIDCDKLIKKLNDVIKDEGN
jgi:hybrid cluster-associated redox disulfide protein